MKTAPKIASPAETITAYVTLHLFTAGITKVTGEVNPAYPKMLTVHETHPFTQYFHGKDWHRTKEEAVAHAFKMIAAKRKSIQKQLAKIDKLDASLPRIAKT
jgi:hypothetical protein